VDRKEYMAAYRIKHAERIRETYRAYKIKYAEKYREKDRIRYQRDKERYQERDRARANRGRDFMYAAKSVPCYDCHKSYAPWIMQFDHLRDKRFTIGSHQVRPIKALVEEIAKCDVVCANCHLDRTHRRSHGGL
jgi:hypothetical protein